MSDPLCGWPCAGGQTHGRHADSRTERSLREVGRSPTRLLGEHPLATPAETPGNWRQHAIAPFRDVMTPPPFTDVDHRIKSVGGRPPEEQAEASHQGNGTRLRDAKHGDQTARFCSAAEADDLDGELDQCPGTPYESLGLGRSDQRRAVLDLHFGGDQLT